MLLFLTYSLSVWYNSNNLLFISIWFTCLQLLVSCILWNWVGSKYPINEIHTININETMQIVDILDIDNMDSTHEDIRGSM